MQLIGVRGTPTFCYLSWQLADTLLYTCVDTDSVKQSFLFKETSAEIPSRIYTAFPYFSIMPMFLLLEQYVFLYDVDILLKRFVDIFIILDFVGSHSHWPTQAATWRTAGPVCHAIRLLFCGDR